MKCENIKGFEDYLIYEDGRVYSRKKNIFLSPRRRGKKKRQYYVVALYDCSNTGKRKDFAIHRLVAEHFIENPNNHPVVNHKDNNPMNNHVDNLEWVTHSENTLHSYHETDRRRLFKKVEQIDRKTDQHLNTYNSLQEAQEKTGIHYSLISKCVNGWQKSSGGYKWRYAR